MIQELEDVLVLVRELPEPEQKIAAAALRSIVLQYEDQSTMTAAQYAIVLRERLENHRKRLRNLFGRGSAT